jgi:hypothetical protein
VSIFFRQFERGHAILTFVILLSSLTSGEERTSKSHHNSKVCNASPSVERVSFDRALLLGCFHIAGRVEIALSMKVPYVTLLCYYKKGDRH